MAAARHPCTLTNTIRDSIQDGDWPKPLVSNLTFSTHNCILTQQLKTPINFRDNATLQLSLHTTMLIPSHTTKYKVCGLGINLSMYPIPLHQLPQRTTLTHPRPLILVSTTLIFLFYTTTSTNMSSSTPIPATPAQDFHFAYTVQKGFFLQSEDETDDREFDFVRTSSLVLVLLVLLHDEI